MNLFSKVRAQVTGTAPPDPWLQLILRSDRVRRSEIDAAVAAVTEQVKTQLAPAWDVGENLVIEIIDKNHQPSDKAWWVLIADDPDVAGALGYHDVTAEGRPLAKCFTRPTLDAGEEFSGVISHEVCEMLVDQRINLWAYDEHGGFYALESSDAVQGNDYKLGGVLVADFVLPSFFHQADRTPPFDFLGVVEESFQTLPEGYQIYYTANDGMQQLLGSRAASTPLAGSRRERRMRGHAQWRRSEWY